MTLILIEGRNIKGSREYYWLMNMAKIALYLRAFMNNKFLRVHMKKRQKAKDWKKSLWIPYDRIKI